MTFAVAQPGTKPDPADLLEWTAERVDERPARPKWVELIEIMPTTNVGKIFKPELLRRASERVSELIVKLTADHPSLLGIEASARMEADGRIVVAIALPDRINETAADALRKVVDPLPVVVIYTAAAPGGGA